MASWCPSILSGFVCPCSSSSKSYLSFVLPPGGSLSKRARSGVRAVVVLELGIAEGVRTCQAA